MSFLNLSPVLLLGAAVAAAVVAASLSYGRRRRARILACLVGEARPGRLVTNVHSGFRRTKAVLLAVGMVFLFVAAARPWWGRRLVPAPNRSRDLLIALDTSRSMLARDVAPSRLDHAKWLIGEMIERLPGDRFGLIAFAGSAFLECPLTQDRNTLFLFLEEIDTRTIPVGGTNIGAALKQASQAFEGAEGGDRAVILISDGDELQGDSTKLLADFHDREIPLFVVGVGDPAQAAMIQLADNSFLRDAKGELVSTRLDEARLGRLARDTDGLYVRSTAVAPNLPSLLRRIREMVPEEDETTTSLRPIERYQGPLAIGVLCLILRLFIGERRSGPAVAAALLTTAVMMGSPSPAHAQVVPSVPAPSLGVQAPLALPDGPDALGGLSDDEASKLRDDIAEIEGALGEAPAERRPRLHYNLGVLRQQLGELDEAASAFRTAANEAGEGDLARAWALWNLGAISHLKGRGAVGEDPEGALKEYRQAVAHYRDAMRLQPDVRELGTNQELLLADRRTAELLQKLDQQLQEMLDKARQETVEARDRQRDANAEEQQADRRRKQEEAVEETQQADQAVSRLSDLLDAVAAQTGQGGTTQPAKQAREEIAKAREVQQRSSEESGKQAEEHLANAARLLGADDEQQQQDQQQDGDQQDQQQQNEDGQKQQPESGEDQQQPQQAPDEDLMQQLAQQQQQAELKQGEEGESGGQDEAYDKEQARGLLMRMLESEQELREALKEYERRQYKTRPAERDW